MRRLQLVRRLLLLKDRDPAGLVAPVGKGVAATRAGLFLGRAQILCLAPMQRHVVVQHLQLVRRLLLLKDRNSAGLAASVSK